MIHRVSQQPKEAQAVLDEGRPGAPVGFLVHGQNAPQGCEQLLGLLHRSVCARLASLQSDHLQTACGSCQATCRTGVVQAQHRLGSVLDAITKLARP